MQYWITASFVIVLIGFSKSGFGGGPGVLATPILTTVIDPASAVAIMLPLMLLCDVWCVYRYYKDCVWSLALRLLAGFIVGTAIATLLLAGVPGQEIWLRKVIGMLSIIFGLAYFLVLRDQSKIAKYVPQGVWFGLIMGVIAGISSTLAHAAGPPVAMYLLSQAKGQEKGNFMGTMVTYTLLGNLLKVPSYLISGSLNMQNFALTWPLIWAIPVGLALGWYLNNKIQSEKFPVWINAILIAIGAYLLLS